MLSIRKFVVGAGTAGLLAAGALLLFAQTGTAATRSFDEGPPTSQAISVSPACTAAIQSIKAAVAADRTEDAAERAVAKTEGVGATDQAEDASERANFISLFKAARTACAPAPAKPIERTFTSSAACTSAVQALKAAWAKGRPTTLAQWQQLQSLFQAARTACGLTRTGSTTATWSWDRS
jgi:hypothetical protein